MQPSTLVQFLMAETGWRETGRGISVANIASLAACAKAFDRRIKYLRDVVDGKIDADVSDRLRAMDLLAKYGLGTTTTPTDIEGRDLPPARMSPEEIAARVRELMREGRPS